MTLSIIVACVDAGRSITECLRRLEIARTAVDAEVIVVDASSDDTIPRVEAFGGDVQVIQMAPGTLTPRLWAEGYRRAKGRVIAFTTGHCLVTPWWAAALVEAIDAGAAGAGGPLVLAPEARTLDVAVYYLRYSGCIPAIFGSGRVTGEIAGDNAAYDRRWLERFNDSLADGFWEFDFHRLVRAEGGWLVAVPAAQVEFGRSFPAATIVRHRFAHAVLFGAERVHQRSRSALQMVLASPFVPAVLLGRAAHRVFRSRSPVRRFLAAVPWFTVLAATWAAGEAKGAVRASAVQAQRSARDGTTLVPEHSDPSHLSNGAQV